VAGLLLVYLKLKSPHCKYASLLKDSGGYQQSWVYSLAVAVYALMCVLASESNTNGTISFFQNENCFSAYL
jgi:hypothetical protein